MRAPLKHLAPLILVPFLASDGSPLEPDTEQAATELVQPPASDALVKAGKGNGWGGHKNDMEARRDDDEKAEDVAVTADGEQPPRDDTRGRGMKGRGNGLTPQLA